MKVILYLGIYILIGFLSALLCAVIERIEPSGPDDNGMTLAMFLLWPLMYILVVGIACKMAFDALADYIANRINEKNKERKEKP